ncbi:fanconi-associated nuclease 1-like [Thrips palmi]|uniref:Fanconi-associated nuclease n=1 Tax=Thrips palmi TaxID=161013 RepID=A0A6P8XX36_THRPL|nr:fanconi-associated nuclease 1-like [Thrips palmi]
MAASTASTSTGHTQADDDEDVAAAAGLKRCWVVVERLPAAHRANVNGGGAPAVPAKHDHAGLTRECSVVLEKLDLGNNTTWTLDSVARAKRPKKATAKGVQWDTRLRHEKRRRALRDGAVQKKAALLVTQRSAWRRGRARGWKTATASTAKSTTTSSTASENAAADEHKLLYLSTFGDLVKKLAEETGDCSSTLAEYERQVLRQWLQLSAETGAVYLRLLGLKEPWIRGSQVRCQEGSILEHFAALAQTGFVSSEFQSADLKHILELLRKDEVEAVADGLVTLPASSKRNKLSFVRAVQRFSVETPQALPRLQARLCVALGGCVRVLAVPRQLVERVLLLLAAWAPCPPDGDRLRAARAMLLRPVPQPLRLEGLGWRGLPPPLRCMFTTRQQAVAWESIASHRTDLEEAVKQSHWPKVANVTEELLQSYRSHLATCSLNDDVANRTLGNALAEALTVAAETLVRSWEEDKKTLALTVYCELLGQRLHAQEKRVLWVAGHTKLMQATPDGQHAAAELLIGELEDGGHRGAQRAHLERSAAAFLAFVQRPQGQGRGRGDQADLTEDVRARLAELLSAPVELQDLAVVRLTASALPGKSASLKKVFVFQPAAGAKKQHLSVEERVMAKYAKSGEFPLGLDDEGETLVSLAVLAFWNAVYDGGVDDAWGSPCQDRPLDWATDRFWVTRHMAMEERCDALLQHADAEGHAAVAADLLAARDALAGTPSLVRWQLLQELDLEGLLKCISVPLFVAICRRLLSDFSSYRSGFPDLLLWNPTESKSLFVEVKGPKDELSLHQAKWLEFLKQSGATVAVVEVRTK